MLRITNCVNSKLDIWCANTAVWSTILTSNNISCANININIKNAKPVRAILSP